MSLILPLTIASGPVWGAWKGYTYFDRGHFHEEGKRRKPVSVGDIACNVALGAVVGGIAGVMVIPVTVMQLTMGVLFPANLFGAMSDGVDEVFRMCSSHELCTCQNPGSYKSDYTPRFR